MKSIKIALIVSVCSFLSACESYEPVAVSKCNAVVNHSKKILGKMAPETAEMMRQCKSASDSERGCVMAATTAGKLMNC